MLAGNRYRPASEFARICREKTKTTIAEFIQEAQFDVTQAGLEKTFQKLVGLPDTRRQHHINVLHKDVIEYAPYLTRTQQYVFKF